MEKTFPTKRVGVETVCYVRNNDVAQSVAGPMLNGGRRGRWTIESISEARKTSASSTRMVNVTDGKGKIFAPYNES